MRARKARHLTPENAAVFSLRTVAEAYGRRPEYPPEVPALLASLVADRTLPVLELGAGTAQLGRAIAPSVQRVDALEIADEMVRVGRTLPGGDHANLRWIVSAAETFDFEGPYGLVFAAAALHWMDWDIVLPKIAGSLVKGAYFAIVSGLSTRTPWGAALGGLVSDYSTIRDFEPFDLVSDLTTQGLWVQVGHRRTTTHEMRLSLDEYLDWLHTQSGLATDLMGATAIDFDAHVRHLVEPFATAGALTVSMDSDVDWGIPTGLSTTA